MRYFHTENLLIAAGGVTLGAALAVAGNIWIVHSFEMPRLPLHYVLYGTAAMLVIGQLSALWPAWRAAIVPPAEAASSD